MIISEIFYGIKCNRCNETCGEEHAFWCDEESAIENAMESEWIEEKGKHYCPNCYEFDEEKDDNISKPDYPEHIKKLKKFLDKIVVGVSETTKETTETFTLIKGLYNETKLSEVNENYIRQFLGDKLVSIECKKHERYTRFYCYITVLR